jgi:hypothetical protein
MREAKILPKYSCASDKGVGNGNWKESNDHQQEGNQPITDNRRPILFDKIDRGSGRKIH